MAPKFCDAQHNGKVSVSALDTYRPSLPSPPPAQVTRTGQRVVSRRDLVGEETGADGNSTRKCESRDAVNAGDD